MSADIQGGGNFTCRDIPQSKMDGSSLHSGQLFLFFGLLCRRATRGDHRHIFAPALACRRRWDTMKPVLHLSVSREAPSEDPALQLGQLQLLVCEGVVAGDTDILDDKLIVLPGDIFQRDSTGAREILKRPCAISLQLSHSLAEIVAESNCRRFL